jgi:hypothetical protein
MNETAVSNARHGRPCFFGNLFASKFYKNFDEFYGCLKNSEVFEGDSGLVQ